MKLKFKVQAFQTNAVDSVVDCFAGQPRSEGISCRIDPGRGIFRAPGQHQQALLETQGFKNSDLFLTEQQVLDNIRAVQQRQNLPLSDRQKKVKSALGSQEFFFSANPPLSEAPFPPSAWTGAGAGCC